jgi:hypothetical protein
MRAGVPIEQKYNHFCIGRFLQANDMQLRGGKMTTRPSIKNEQEHKTALAAIEQLLESEPGTPQGIEFEILARLIEEYEDIHYPLKE